MKDKKPEETGTFPPARRCHFRIWIGILLFLLLWTPSGTRAQVESSNHIFVSWTPLEPDMCIAAWLYKNHVDPAAEFRFVPRGAVITNGIPFDVPGSRYVRDHKRSASEWVIENHRLADPKAAALGALARKLELGFWNAVYSDAEQPLIDSLKSILGSPASPNAALEQSFTLLDAWKAASADYTAPREAGP